MLQDEGDYNLNVLKEVLVTDFFHGMDRADKECQNKEAQEDCTTRQYIGNILQKCQCLPLSIITSNNVCT